ncbi:MAG: M81 family metallopeptidase [Anaerolineales bacterium]|nr:M81 family metallopeptidase [Anaerolineales bacterium]
MNQALPLDGLLLSPHGALVGVADSGVEGLVLQKARRIVGEDAIIGVFMNLHANITKREDKKRGYDLWVAHTSPCG